MADRELLHVNKLVAKTIIAETVKNGADIDTGDAGTAVPVNASSWTIPQNATITLGTAASHAQLATIQIKDGEGNALAQVANLKAFLSDASTGLGVTAAAPEDLALPSTGNKGKIIAEHTANAVQEVQTDATGALTLEVTDDSTGAGQTAGTDWFLVIVLPTGRNIVSGAIIPSPAG